MTLRANGIYVTPDGRFMLARKQILQTMPEPAWTLMPYPVPRHCPADLCLYLEHGKLFGVEFTNAGSPVVRDTGWTSHDLIDTGRVHDPVSDKPCRRIQKPKHS